MNYFQKTLMIIGCLCLSLGVSFVFAETTGPWQQVVETEQPCRIAGFANENYGIAAGNGGDTYYTVDGGKTWTQSQIDALTRYGLEILDEKTAWTCGDAGVNRVTHDGGKTWQELGDFGEEANHLNHCKNLNFCDETHAWIAARHRLAVTQDGGKSWLELTPPANIEIAAIALRTPTEGYLLDITKEGMLYQTLDGGKTWISWKVGLKGDRIDGISFPTAAIRFTDAKNAVIVVDRKDATVWALRSQDGGKKWTQELVPTKAGALYLSRDGKYLTVTDPSLGGITVWKRK